MRHIENLLCLMCLVHNVPPVFNKYWLWIPWLQNFAHIEKKGKVKENGKWRAFGLRLLFFFIYIRVCLRNKFWEGSYLSQSRNILLHKLSVEKLEGILCSNRWALLQTQLSQTWSLLLKKQWEIEKAEVVEKGRELMLRKLHWEQITDSEEYIIFLNVKTSYILKHK